MMAFALHSRPDNYRDFRRMGGQIYDGYVVLSNAFIVNLSHHITEMA